MNKSITINKILERLQNYPDAEYYANQDSVTVFPKDGTGFPVTLTSHFDTAYTVNYDFWQEEFETEDEALDYFALGLTNKCRLKVTMRGNEKYMWTLESEKNGKWLSASATGLFNIAFWKPKKEIYLQNNMVM